MALIFLEVLILFTVSSFEFQPVRLPWLYRYWWVPPPPPQFTWPQTIELSGLGAMLESYRNLQQKPKTVLEFK